MDPLPSFTQCTRWLRSRIGRGLTVGSACLALVLALALPSACTEVPPNLPTSEAFKRTVPRIELVSLVISDAERAERVRNLYIEIESLMLATKKTQAAQWMALLQAKDRKLKDDEVRSIVLKFREAELEALRKYAKIQVQLRENTTPEEFAKLDKLK